MFREMRRKQQQLSPRENDEILRRCTSGVLAVTGDDGYPYAVPLSYVYQDGKLWFHGAVTGHKLDAVLQNDKVSFCVIDQDEVVPEKLTSAYRSVIVFGRARVLEDEAEIRRAARWLGEKYDPANSSDMDREIDQAIHRMRMIRLDIEHMTGKEGIVLTQTRKNKE